MARGWGIAAPEPDLADRALRSGLHPGALAVLDARGIRGEAGLREHLETRVDDLLDPYEIHGMKRAVARVHRAITEKEPVMVLGDYDVDGTCGAALATHMLRALGARVTPRIAERLEDGYGLSPRAVARVLAEKPKVLICVDHGINAVAQVAELRAAGIDTVICDHHLPGDEVPDAAAVLDPAVQGDGAPGRALCGAGVACKLMWALAAAAGPGRRDELAPVLLRTLALAAVATVADLVPLDIENRRIVRLGLRAIAGAGPVGLRTLADKCRVDPARVLAEDISFGLAPRLNAAGRMGAGAEALELLLALDEGPAQAAAKTLESRNRRRRRTEDSVWKEARGAGKDADRIIVAAGKGWHPGVLGIVASRLVEAHGKPAFVIATNKGRGRGSARSGGFVSIHEGLEACSGILEGFGGHAFAAGFDIAPDRVDELRAALEEWALTAAPPVPPGHGDADAVLPLADVGFDLIRDLERVGPFGKGFDRPRFAVHDAMLEGLTTSGHDDRHLVLNLGQGEAKRRAVAYGRGGRLEELAGRDTVDVLFTPGLTRGGRPQIELRILDFA